MSRRRPCWTVAPLQHFHTAQQQDGDVEQPRPTDGIACMWGGKIRRVLYRMEMFLFIYIYIVCNVIHAGVYDVYKYNIYTANF